MATLRKLGLVITLILFVMSASATWSVGVVAAGSPSVPSPHSLHALAFSNPRVTIGTSSPRLRTATSVACDGAFDAVASPNGTGHNDIFGTSAVSANDVWSVGIQTIAAGYDRTLAEHWNGTAWSIVATPNPATTYWADLNAVKAIATNDVWAVGDYQIDASGSVSTFAEHWNGISWTLTTATSNARTFNWLFSVDAVSSTDVWAVGSSWSAGYFTLVEHWDGNAWSIVQSPNQGIGLGFASNQLFSVSAFSSSDVWAAGSFAGTTFQSLAEHWNGSTWNLINTPNETGNNEIASVLALEGGHALAVGYGKASGGTTPAQAEAWDLVTAGASTNVALAGPGSCDNIVEAVARSGANVWGVGFWRATSSSARQTLAWPATWDSTSHTVTWGSVGVSASPAVTNNALFTVAAVSPNIFWAAGYMNGGGYDQSLMEAYCALHFGITAPTAAFKGAPFSVTVTAKNANATTNTGYRGTVGFSSTDGAAVLPAVYTFTSLDAGAHTFTGVVLNTLYDQTITVSDTSTGFISGSTVIRVTCRGACQGPAGTSGSRSDNHSNGGTPGSRAANPSTAVAPPGPPGSRVADFRTGASDQAAAASTVPTQAGGGTGPTQTRSGAVQSVRAPGVARSGRIVVDEPVRFVRPGLSTWRASQPGASVGGYNSPFLPGTGVVAGLLVLLLFWAWRRKNRGLNGQPRT